MKKRMMNKDSRILVTGAGTMEGIVLADALKKHGYENIFSAAAGQNLREYYESEPPEFVFLLGDSSGGIKANIEKPATLMTDNLLRIMEVISLSLAFEVKKLIFLASSCVYPKHIEKPMSPQMLMTGPLEQTNSAYAIAKLAGIELIKSIRKEHNKNFISSISANCFGPYDDFISEDSHVVSSLIRRMHLAKLEELDSVSVWGSGNPVRDFLYVEDLVEGLIYLMKNYNESSPVNIASSKGTSIKDLSYKIKEVVGYRGKLIFDTSLPDGMMHKVLDNRSINELGWNSNFSLDNALKLTYDWHLKNLH
jgi:GDP-L-fucose synthase